MCMFQAEQELSESSIMEPIAVPALSKPAMRKSRKRVRFTDHDEDETGEGREGSCKRRVLEFLPLSSEISPEEKKARWLQREDRNEIRKFAHEHAQEWRLSDAKKIASGQGHLTFSETYANLYGVCHLIEDFENENAVFDVLTPEVVSHMATSNTRGLEDRTVPRVALQRRLSRRLIVRTVLSMHGRNVEPNDMQEAVRSMTLPSRRFAEVLGVADATAAMIEYSYHTHPQDDTSSRREDWEKLLPSEKISQEASSLPATVATCA